MVREVQLAARTREEVAIKVDDRQMLAGPLVDELLEPGPDRQLRRHERASEGVSERVCELSRCCDSNEPRD